MTMRKQDIKTFEDLSEKHSTWIIKYCSATFDNPLFLVWYIDSDDNSTNRLLTYKNGEIFSDKSLTNIKKSILSLMDNLIEFENLNLWLDNFNNLEPTEHCNYDLISIVNKIDNNNLDISTIEGITGFVNLYDDFINQDERNMSLQHYADIPVIKEVWEYFYDSIFWPRFSNKEKFKTSDRTKLEIDSKELLVKLKVLIKTFDDKIEQTERPSANIA